MCTLPNSGRAYSRVAKAKHGRVCNRTEYSQSQGPSNLTCSPEIPNRPASTNQNRAKSLYTIRVAIRECNSKNLYARRDRDSRSPPPCAISRSAPDSRQSRHWKNLPPGTEGPLSVPKICVLMFPVRPSTETCWMPDQSRRWLGELSWVDWSV